MRTLCPGCVITSRGRIFWTKQDEQSLLEGCRAQVDTETDAYLATPVQPVSAMFDYLFEELPDTLLAQREHAIKAEQG